MYDGEPKLFDQVRLLAYVNTVDYDYDLQPGDYGIITQIGEKEVRVAVVCNDARARAFRGHEFEDHFFAPLNELDEWFEDFIRIDK